MIEIRTTRTRDDIDANKEKIKHISSARQKVMNTAKKILREEMNEYVDKFGWDQDIDSWLWYGVNDCGISFLVAVNCSVKNAEYMDITKQLEDEKRDDTKPRDFEEVANELGI